MDKELGDECEAHSVPLTLWCSTDSALVCYRCLLFGDHKGHECLDEEETRSAILQRKKSQKEEEMLEQIQAIVKEVKDKIEERFDELIKRLTEDHEIEKRLVEVQYNQFYKLAVKENKKEIESLQYLPLMATLQSVHVQPGQIQWPQLNLPNMADLHLGSAEAGEIVQQEGDLEQNLVQNVEEEEKEGYQEGNQEVNQEVKREREPLNGSLGSRVAAALSFHRNSARKDEEEEEETVKIVEVCSPWKIQVVSSRHWTIWEMLRQAVAREGESAKFRRKKTVSKGDKALLYINKRWERVIIKKVGEGSQTKVKLIDVGSSVEIPTGDLREMSVELQRSPCFTKAISLAGVKCGPDETWKIAITEKLREILPVNKILSFKRLRQGGVLGDLFIEKTDEDQKIVKVSVTQILTELSIFIPPTSPIVQEESNNNLINKNNTRGEKTVEMYRQKTSPIRKSKLRPMLTPLLPGSGFFRAKIVHIDRRGVVWVLPNDHIRLLAEVTAEISICTDVSEESQVDVGNLLVCQTGRTVVRGRILEVKEGGVVFLDVDTGETGQCELQKVFAITPNLLSISPLAIPIWLYGLEQTRNLLDGRVVARLLETIPRAQVTVSLLEPGLTSSFPLLANVRYSGRSQAELESNLALTLLEWGLMSVETSHRQRQLSGLGWLNLSSSLPPPLYNPPHPFPLAEGLWLSVTVQGIYFPLDEEQPTIECPHANRVSCHLVPLSSDRNFGFCHREITSSAKVSKNPLKALEISYEDLRVKLAADAEQGEGVKAVSPGDGVIVLVGQEWCRATVLRQLRNQVVQVSYTDYGHNGEAHIKDLRTMKEKRRLEPVQVREFSYQMPESNEELEDIRSTLKLFSYFSYSEKLLVRIEKIVQRDQLEEVMVTFWKAKENFSEASFELIKIC